MTTSQRTASNLEAFESMTSSEVAEVTLKGHSQVLRDIEKMRQAIQESGQIITATHMDSDGIERREYRLDHEATLALVAGYSPFQRRSIVQYWIALEHRISPAEKMIREGKELLRAEHKERDAKEAIDREKSRLKNLEMEKFTILWWYVRARQGAAPAYPYPQWLIDDMLLLIDDLLYVPGVDWGEVAREADMSG